MSDIPANDLLPRVAVLEQIARSVDTQLGDIRGDIRGLRSDMREIREAQRTDFRWLMTLWISGIGVLLAVMAHGFHWI